MSIQEIRVLSGIRTPDDSSLYVVRRDLSGGVNTRQHASSINDTQANTLTNCDIGTKGKIIKAYGSVLIGDDVGNTTPVTLHNYTIQGGTDQLLMYEGTTLWKWTGSGNWASVKNDFTAATTCGILSCKESGLSPDDVVIVSNRTNNAFRIDSSGNAQDLGDTNTSPPKTDVMCWYGNRVWGLKNDLLYWSDAYDDDYSGAFDRSTNSFRIPVGEERCLFPTRNLGIIVCGKGGIWALAPSTTPDPSTDKPEPIITNHGVVSKKGGIIWGDDIYYFAQDGLRSLKRTEQDKLQMGTNYPISYRLKDEYAKINFAYIEQLSMEAYDDKIFIAVPTGASTYDTWVYYPAQDAFMVISGWSPACWAKYKVNSTEYLYYGKQGDGTVYRAWYGYTDEGTTTTNGTAKTETITGREEDFGQPLIKKVGGELEIEAEASGSGYSFTVNVALDGGAFQNLGTVDLSSSTAPVLPVALPFALADSYVVRQKFHLDSLGAFRTLQVQIINTDANTEDIVFYSYKITTFAEELENE